MNRIGDALQRSRTAQLAEMLVVFALASVVVAIGWSLVGSNPFARQVVVWIANILMLGIIWIGLRLRGQGWDHFGLTFQLPGPRVLVYRLLQSVVVLVVALAGFIVGSAIIMNLTDTAQKANMSGYNYLQGNLPMLLVALIAVYIVSSFGEEAIYRGFLINRIAEIGSGGRPAWGLAVVLSAVVFGLIHFDWGIVGVVQTTFMGLALGISYLVLNRNLWVLVLAHAYLDTLLLVQLYLAPPAGG